MPYPSYKNGNYIVTDRSIFGTIEKRALRFGEDFIPEFPDSIDLKLSNRCSTGCQFCHEKSIETGKLANLDELKKHLRDIPRVPIEFALGGGNLLEDQESKELLKETVTWLVEEGFNVGLTINENMVTYKNIKFIQQGILKPGNDYFKRLGLGISLGPGTTKSRLKEIIKNLEKWEWGTIGKQTLGITPVFHVILGLVSRDLLQGILRGKIKTGFAKGIRVLFLGYKQFGRAENTKLPNSIPEFEAEIKHAIIRGRETGINAYSNLTLGFDNLAIEQLNLKGAFLKKEFKDIYLGDEFTCSMYIDAVEGMYAKTSRSKERVRWNDCGILEFFKDDKTEIQTGSEGN